MSASPDIPSLPMLLASSSCLLGEEVRYDGNHRHNAYLTRTLGEVFALRGFCPEVAIGLGIPRPPIRLVRSGEQVRVRGVQDPQQDVSEALETYARQVAADLQGVCGYLFKRGSPSCGMERVRVYDEDSGMPVAVSAGRYAATLMHMIPELPCEEEGRLMDPRLRDNFIERVFVYHRWQCYCAAGLSPALLVDFHTRHKLIVLAHDEPAYRELGRRVADAGSGDLAGLARDYIRELMQALQQPATPKQHCNVLMHILGYFKPQLGSDEKQAVLAVLEDYRHGRLPLIAPLTLLRHYQRLYPHAYLDGQYYLQAEPRELILREHL